jgi:hypothetical protein
MLTGLPIKVNLSLRSRIQATNQPAQIGLAGLICSQDDGDLSCRKGVVKPVGAVGLQAHVGNLKHGMRFSFLLW